MADKKQQKLYGGPEPEVDIECVMLMLIGVAVVMGYVIVAWVK